MPKSRYYDDLILVFLAPCYLLSQYFYAHARVVRHFNALLFRIIHVYSASFLIMTFKWFVSLLRGVAVGLFDGLWSLMIRIMITCCFLHSYSLHLSFLNYFKEVPMFRITLFAIFRIMRFYLFCHLDSLCFPVHSF